MRWSLAEAGVDVAAARRAALGRIGAPPDLAIISMPPLTRAGTVESPRAWRVLIWRQQHLPLSRIRRASHLAARESLEQRTAWHVADKAGVDEDQRWSLLDQQLSALAQAEHRSPSEVIRAALTEYIAAHAAG